MRSGTDTINTGATDVLKKNFFFWLLLHTLTILSTFGSKSWSHIWRNNAYKAQSFRGVRSSVQLNSKS